ncbi:MAG: STAS domain-containing protein [Phycisphaerales bacterium]
MHWCAPRCSLRRLPAEAVGDIDLSRSPRLRTALAEASARKPQRLVVDLSQVPYMDSSGIATLIEALQVARAQRTKFLLAALQPRVKSVLEIARLDTVFKIVATTAEAKSA